jgi:hypothetical protein
VAETVETLLAGDRRMKAITMLHGYIDGYLKGYAVTLRSKAQAGDQGAQATMYAIHLSIVKLASRLQPVTAESAYLEGLKEIEGATSIHVVVLSDEITGR